MTDEFVRTAVLGVAAALFAFELVVAAMSLYDAWSTGRGRDRTAPWLGRTNHRPLLLSPAFAIRGHLAQRRPVMNALRSQYAMLGTNGHGRQLRGVIGRVRPGRSTDVAADCQSCRPARLKGQGRCFDCGRRLVVPVAPAST
jgi:hypothetical protein